jgi:hypothetical protein
VVDGVDELQDHLEVVGEEQRLLVAVLHDDVQDPEGAEDVLVLVEVGTLLDEDVLDVLDAQEQVATLCGSERDLAGHHLNITNDAGLLNPHVGVHWATSFGSGIDIECSWRTIRAQAVLCAGCSPQHS